MKIHMGVVAFIALALFSLAGSGFFAFIALTDKGNGAPDGGHCEISGKTDPLCFANYQVSREWLNMRETNDLHRQLAIAGIGALAAVTFAGCAVAAGRSSTPLRMPPQPVQPQPYR